MSKGEATTCKKCNRAVYAEHVDKDGLCVFCQPRGPERRQPPLVEKPKERKKP